MKKFVFAIVILIILAAGCTNQPKQLPASESISPSSSAPADPCKDISCKENEVCRNGICELNSCSSLNGTICADAQVCNGKSTVTKDSATCCIGVCKEPDSCNSDSACNDNKVSTEDICTGTPKKCENIPITTCKNGDLYCPSDCKVENDNDCPARGDLKVNNQIDAAAIYSDGGFLEVPVCGKNNYRQGIVFSVSNYFKEDVSGLKFAAYIDGKKTDPADFGSDGILRKTSIGNSKVLSYNDPKTSNLNQVFFYFNSGLAGHKIRVEIDPENQYIEKDEKNNYVERDFPNERFDVIYAENCEPGPCISPVEDEGQMPMGVRVVKTTAGADCPDMSFDISIDGKRVLDNYKFLGFISDDPKYGKNSRGTVLIYGVSPGKHDIRIVVDPADRIKESNESNQVIEKHVENYLDYENPIIIS